MFIKTKSIPGSDNIDTLIGANTVFEGNIECQGSIRLEGKIKGDVNITGDIFVGHDASITGNVRAINVHLAGSIEGNVYASGILRLTSSGKINGDIQIRSFVADEGGIFNGKCSMLESSSAFELDSPKTFELPEKPVARERHSRNYRKSAVLENLDEADENKGEKEEEKV